VPRLAVIGAVGVSGVMSGIIGLCAWKSGADIAILGATLSALSPATLIFACINPGSALYETIDQAGLPQARVALIVGSAIAAAVYAAIVYGVHASMVKNFDFTVRKLAGVQ